MIVKEKVIKFIAVWEKGVVRARIEFVTHSTPWLEKPCKKVELAEAVAESLFDMLKIIRL